MRILRALSIRSQLTLMVMATTCFALVISLVALGWFDQFSFRERLRRAPDYFGYMRALVKSRGDKPAERQRFEFYNILEGKQPAASGTTAPAPATPATPAAAPGVTVTLATEAKPAPSEVFFLQVGAFQKAADADNLKAKLALTGLEASVQEVGIPEKGTMHRVRVGPFRAAAEMNRARTLLSQSGVQVTVIKQKE